MKVARLKYTEMFPHLIWQGLMNCKKYFQLGARSLGVTNSDVNKDSTVKAKAKAKDWTSKAKAKAKA